MVRAENISPSILTWARETAGLSRADAATRLGLSSSARSTAIDKLDALERGDTKPTRVQLLKIAATYKRPLTAFYRLTPPVSSESGEDFRTLSGPVSNEESARLDAILRDIRARHDMVRSILEDDDDVHPLGFVGTLSIESQVDEAVREIHKLLKIHDNQMFRHNLYSPAALFSALRERIEDVGVFVLLVGNLGSYHTSVSEQIFRGFAIADDIAPFVVINDQDAVSARSFTLIHELVHILMGSSGVSNIPFSVTLNARLTYIERYCNEVAGKFLLPEALLENCQRVETYTAAEEVIPNIASQQKVSEAMVAYRLWSTDRLDNDIYRQLVTTYAARWKREKERRREKARDEEIGGPSYYVVRRHRLGDALIGVVGRTLRANELTHTKAAKILGVKPSSVEPILRQFGY